MNKKEMINRFLRPFGVEVQRTTAHEEKPWDHTFRKGVAEERGGGGPEPSRGRSLGKASMGEVYSTPCEGWDGRVRNRTRGWAMDQIPHGRIQQALPYRLFQDGL